MPNLTRLHMAADVLERFHKQRTGIRGFFYRLFKGENIINFDIGNWRETNRIICERDGHPCGTTACAMGYLAMSPEGKALGLTLKLPYIYSNNLQPHYQGAFGFDAAARFFDIKLVEAQRLFHASGYKRGSKATALDVANKIRSMFPAAPKNSLDV